MDAVVVTCDSAVELARLVDCVPLRRAIRKLVVVDNGSDDASREIASQAGAVVIPRSTREGYGAAVNLGIAATDGPYVAVLNPDIRLRDAGDLDRLTSHFADRRTAIVAPALELPDGSIQDSAREVPTPVELLVRRRWSPRLGAIDRPGSVPWVVGACVIARRDALESIGGFDPGFALYFEDVDVCVRLRKAGWQVIYDPEVNALHEHRAASRQSLLGWTTRTHARSAARFFRRHPEYILARGRRGQRVAETR